MSRASTSFSSAPVRISATPAATAAIQSASLSEPVCSVAPGGQRQRTYDGGATRRARTGGAVRRRAAPGVGRTPAGPRRARAGELPQPLSQRSRAARAPASVSSPSSNVNWVSQAWPSRSPTTISRDDQPGLVGGGLGEGKGAEGHRAGAGAVHGVGDVRLEDQVPPPDVRLEEALRARWR